MKKAILALALVMSMGATQMSWASSAPKHRYHPTTQQVDQQDAQEKAADGKTASADQKASAQDDGALEAYSDTTSADSAINDACDNDDAHAYHSKYSLGNYGVTPLFQWLRKVHHQVLRSDPWSRFSCAGACR